MNKTLFGFVAFLLLCVLFSFGEKEATPFDIAALQAYEIYRISYPTDGVPDTITNTSADTITLSPNLYSLWSSYFTFDATEESGTSSVACQLYQSNTETGNDWFAVGSAATINATGSFAIAVANLNGRRARVILTGSGTQVTSYKMNVTLKK